MRLSGIAGTFEIADESASRLVVRSIADYTTGDLVLEDATGRCLFLYWAEGRLLVMAMDANGDSLVGVEPTAATGPTIEITLDNGQVDSWPCSATLPVSRAAAVIEGWAHDQLATELAWTPNPPTVA